MFVGGRWVTWSRCLLCVAISLLPTASLVAQQPDGAGLFSSNCAGCHGSDGRGGEHAPNIATAPEVQHLTDADLTSIINKGIAGAGMPAFSWLSQDKILAIVMYLRNLQGRGEAAVVVGNPHIGESLFYGKAGCGECHMINGRGGFIGSDLSFYGAEAKPAEIRALILNPAKSLPASKQLFTVTSKSAQTYSGMLRQEDNFSVTLQSTDGAFHSIAKSDIARLERGTRSLMPGFYGTLLTATEMDDLVSYLVHAGVDAAKSPGARTPNAKNDDEE